MPKILSEMFYNLKPESRYSSQQHIQQYTDSIYKQIINGDLEISKKKTRLEDNPNKKDFQQAIRKRFLDQANKQKYQLSHRLDYISNSINALKKYGQLRQNQTTKSLGKSYSVQSRLKQQQWRQKIKERQEHLRKLKQQSIQRKMKKQDQQKQLQQRIKKQQMQKRRKQVLQSVKQIKQRTNNRQEIKKKQNQRYQQVIKQKKMFQILSQSYQQKQQSFLQERKKKLAQIRNFHQPINQEQIKEHQQKFLQLKKKRQAIRQKQIKMSQSRARSYKPLYMSSYYRQIKEETQRIDEDDPGQARIQRLKQYSKRLKSKFTPSIDERKQEQIIDFIKKEKLVQQNRLKRQQELLQKSRQKGLQYLTKIRDLPKKKKNKQMQKIACKTDRSDKIIYQNYLTHHQRKKNQNSWNKILNSSNDKQLKALQLQFESEKIQSQLKWKQIETRVMKKDDSGEIDQQYYNMIKAKLDLLTQK